jgi:CubicO group peptidase (beta-lactamase class C family)
MGWNISETSGGKQVIWLNGATGGFTSFIAFMPEDGTGVVVLSNQAYPVDDVGLKVLKYFNR